MCVGRIVRFYQLCERRWYGRRFCGAPFQISVSDRGFQGISDGRAVDENYKTTFVAGDVVGVYGVAGGQVVEGISNRKFTLNEKGVMGAGGQPIEYDSASFQDDYILCVLSLSG